MIELNFKVAGYYTLRVRDNKGAIKREVAFPNLIVDTGLEQLASKTMVNCATRCLVGSGNTTPAVTDTALDAEIATTTNVTSTSFSHNSGEGGQWVVYLTRVFTFIAGTATGIIKEIGTEDTTGTLYSRSLVLDIEGAPTAVTILDDESLDVIYRQEKHIPTSSFTGLIHYAGTDYNYTIKCIGVNQAQNDNYWNPENDFIDSLAYALETNIVVSNQTDYPIGTQALRSTYSYNTYIPGSHYRIMNFSWGPTVANFATGVGTITYGVRGGAHSAGFQCALNPKLPKNSERVLNISFKVAWSRIT